MVAGSAGGWSLSEAGSPEAASLGSSLGLSLGLSLGSSASILSRSWEMVLLRLVAWPSFGGWGEDA